MAHRPAALLPRRSFSNLFARGCSEHVVARASIAARRSAEVLSINAASLEPLEGVWLSAMSFGMNCFLEAPSHCA